MLQYSKLHQMVLMILLIGWINIYDTFKNITISTYLNIHENNLLVLIIISCLFIFMLISFQNNLELEIILAISFVALSLLLLSNDMIIFFLTLELYSLSVYLLVYNKPLLTLIYFIIGSISSSFILLSLAFLYLYTGSFNLSFILEYFTTIYNYHTENGIFIALSIFILAMLFKLGSAPFQYWVIRVYSNMDYNILIYQSIIPKIVFLYFILFVFSYNISEFTWIIIFASLLSLIIGAIGPLTYSVKHLKTIMAYSSIYNLGFLLMGVASGGVNNIIQYLFIYSLNTFHLLVALLIPMNNSYYFLSLIISLFSFIGFPPMAGFYAKLNIFINCLNSNHPIFILGIVVMLITTLIASFFYLKFIKNIGSERVTGIDETKSYLFFSFLTLLLALYPFFLSFFSPFFDSFV